MTQQKLIFIAALAAASALAGCGKSSKNQAALIPAHVKTITADNYQSGAQFCETYHSITSKEVGVRVDVPMHYDASSKGTLSLYAYTLRPFDPKKPSYIFVDGGPGQNTHGAMPEFFGGAMNEIRFDQRGLGCSAPETFAIYKDSSLYSSDNNIRDMEAIRKAYGISQWTVYGVSYGTVPATMYGSRYAAVTNAVVLEGTLGDVKLLQSQDYDADKMNLILTTLTVPQRDAFTKLMNEESADSTSIVELLEKYFYYDAGQTIAKLRLAQLISTDGVLNRDLLHKLTAQLNGSIYALPQQPGAIDNNMLAIIYCKNLGKGSVSETSMYYSEARGFYTQPAAASDKACDSVGVTADDRSTYLPANFKTHRPVYYFQGSHDGATLAKGAIEHWQNVPQGKSYFLLAQDGGHNPNLTRLRSTARDLREGETKIFQQAVMAQPITAADVQDMNYFSPAGQPWKLYLTPPKSLKADDELSGHLAGLKLISLLLRSAPAQAQQQAQTPAPAPTPVDWNHLPEGPLQDLLTQKEGLSPLDADVMAQAIKTASAKFKVPTFIIYAAVKQESDFQPYGILYDYGNYSCSISQFNILTWCATFSSSAKDRASVGWPDGLSCDGIGALNENIIYPFYMGANAKQTVQQSGTTDASILSLDPNVLTPQMPGATLAYRQKLFAAGLSFASHCNHTEPALRVMAYTLRDIHDNEVPSALKKAHPAMGWLISDAIYNMGDAAVSLMQIYGGKNIFRILTPQLYVDTLAKILKGKPAASKVLAYKDGDGHDATIGYFQICVSQRHVTSITNAGLPPGTPDVVHEFVEDCETLYPAQ